MDLNKSEKERLQVGIIERQLSDRSKVYSVTIQEPGGISFIELDAVDRRCADNLCSAIRFAIQQNTNISLV